VRRIAIPTAVGLTLILGLTVSRSAPAAEGSTCGNHGTTVQFVDTPSEAARQAAKEHKLVFVLHVSGLFEDPKLT
jgi:hypothetical protein